MQNPFSVFTDSAYANYLTHYHLFVLRMLKSVLMERLQSFPDMCRAVKNLSGLTCPFPAEIKHGDALPSFSSHV